MQHYFPLHLRQQIPRASLQPYNEPLEVSVSVSMSAIDNDEYVYLLILQVVELPVDIGILQLVIILYQVECSLALVVPGFRIGSGFQ